MLLSYPLRRVAVAFAAFLLVSVGQSLAQAQGMTSLLIKSATPSPKTTDTSGTDNAGSKDQLAQVAAQQTDIQSCLLYTSPSPRDRTRSRMPSSA